MVVFGHYRGGFPDTLKVTGILADMSNFTIDLKVQRAKEIPLEKVSLIIFTVYLVIVILMAGLS